MFKKWYKKNHWFLRNGMRHTVKVWQPDEQTFFILILGLIASNEFRSRFREDSNTDSTDKS